MQYIKPATLHDILSKFDFEVLNMPCDPKKIKITESYINRCFAPLSGFLGEYKKELLRAIGLVEDAFIQSLTEETLRKNVDAFFALGTPALIISRAIECNPIILELAIKHKIPVIRTNEITASITSKLFFYLSEKLAPTISMHGVLVEVHGEGILIKGESGIGKSMTAIKLLQKGHKLVADDRVDVKKLSEDRLVGFPAETTANYIEVRGIGIVDIKALMGFESMLSDKVITLLVNLVPWDDCKNIERYGIDENFEEILGVKVPFVTIPVVPGSDIADVVEIAAVNARARRQGHNSAQKLEEELSAINKVINP